MLQNHAAQASNDLATIENHEHTVTIADRQTDK